jgi:homoserine kinase
MIPLKAMVAQTAALARLIDALHRGDVVAAAAAMEQDGIIEPARAHLMPKLPEVRSAAKQAGALGLVISGAGPTLCAVCDSASVAGNVAATMQAVYEGAGISAISRATTVCPDGARVLSVQ